jgi:hypothetical protein
MFSVRHLSPRTDDAYIHQIPHLPGFIQQFGSQLALRYHRPEASIALDVQHQSCLLYGGSFEPAYMMTISTLSSHLQPATNKRNAAMLQRYLDETLRIPPTRGCLKFIPLGEENLAHGGLTMAGHLTSLGQSTSTSKGQEVERTDSSRRKLGRRLSVKVYGHLSPDERESKQIWPLTSSSPLHRSKANRAGSILPCPRTLKVPHCQMSLRMWSPMRRRRAGIRV